LDFLPLFGSKYQKQREWEKKTHESISSRRRIGWRIWWRIWCVVREESPHHVFLEWGVPRGLITRRKTGCQRCTMRRRRRVVMVTRAGRPRVTRNGSRTRVGRRRIVTRAGRPRVTGSGSLTRVGRRRMRRVRGVERVIIVLDLILRGNEWHTKLLLVPLIKVCGEGRGWRWRGPRRERMTSLGCITTKILMQPVGPATVHRLLDRPGATNGEDAKKALGQTNEKSPASALTLVRTTSSPIAVHRTRGSGGARGAWVMRRLRRWLIRRGRASRPWGSPLRTSSWVGGINPVGYVAGVFDRFFEVSLGDHFDHLHDKWCMKTPFERRPGSTDDLFLDHVKHINTGETVGSKEEKKNPTLPKDVHLIPTLRENGRPGQRVKVPVVPMHVSGRPELLIHRDMNKFSLFPHGQLNVMDSHVAALNVSIREA
jgi:hypothetical protein